MLACMHKKGSSRVMTQPVNQLAGYSRQHDDLNRPIECNVAFFLFSLLYIGEVEVSQKQMYVSKGFKRAFKLKKRMKTLLICECIHSCLRPNHIFLQTAKNARTLSKNPNQVHYTRPTKLKSVFFRQ